MHGHLNVKFYWIHFQGSNLDWLILDDGPIGLLIYSPLKTQNSKNLTYTMTEVWNHAQFQDLVCNLKIEMRIIIISSSELLFFLVYRVFQKELYNFESL